jgi:transposase
MTLCLTVYAAIEYKIRQELIKTDQTLPNQLKKEVKNPTARWIFSLLQGIEVLYINDNQPIIINLTGTKSKIIEILGAEAKKYYFRI